ncbi:MAG: YqgE/AlgH family protein [Propionibacteriaceae bacterium]|jgi:putative transcriptional regulator|nr:YqgE/AlgH family protein [Propionibacteriaceae bacterium]
MDVELGPGVLLVAAIGLSDGVFDQTVVLLIDQDDNGKVGVVLNQFSGYDISSALPQWAKLISEPQVLFDGGPVSKRGAICLATPIGDDEPPGWRPVFDGVGLLNLDTPTEIADGAYSSLRVFAGYAGWDAGQLEKEIEFGMWYVVAAQPEDVFDPHPQTLWQRVLRRQGGDLALYSTWSKASELN